MVELVCAAREFKSRPLRLIIDLVIAGWMVLAEGAGLEVALDGEGAS